MDTQNGSLHHKSPRALRLIAVFKLFKATLLLIAGLAAWTLVSRNVTDVLKHWIGILHADPDNHYIHRFIEKAGLLNRSTLEKVRIGSFFYATLLFIEGVGLWLQRRWGEYLTVIITSSFIPLEIYDFFKKNSWAKVWVIAVNAAIVVYLVRLLACNANATSRNRARE